MAVWWCFNHRLFLLDAWLSGDVLITDCFGCFVLFVYLELLCACVPVFTSSHVYVCMLFAQTRFWALLVCYYSYSLFYLEGAMVYSEMSHWLFQAALCMVCTWRALAGTRQTAVWSNRGLSNWFKNCPFSRLSPLKHTDSNCRFVLLKDLLWR